jgi:predicted ATPase/DNA-binding winged helix-turn-helix (wHTH) protein
MIQIGQLHVFLDNREIRLNGEALRIGSRAFDILELLIRANGAVVSKEEILRRVWPNSVVEENNLQVHVATLRKALARDRDLIRTVPGRGYRLIAASSDKPGSPAPGPGLAIAPKHAAPNPATSIVGRDVTNAEVIGALDAARIVTLVGAGGIGKTAVASQVAARAGSCFRDGVVFVPLDSVSDVRGAYHALAGALGLAVPARCPTLADISRRLAGRRVLLIIDNCEHVVDAVAHLASTIMADSADIHVLATSREALRVPGERLFSIPPLEVPGANAACDEILQTSAVRLFTALIRAADPQFSLDERSVRLIGFICRRLDGIPLAIELAAMRAALLGLEVLAEDVDDHIRTLALGGGFRTAPPRHSTVKATLDWSYRLLDDVERKLLRWLAVFKEWFSFDAACRVAKVGGLSQTQVVHALGGLVSKSLVVRACTNATPRYRLLNMTRAYALQQLETVRDQGAAALAHALHFHAVLNQSPQFQGILSTYQHLIDCGCVVEFGSDHDIAARAALARVLWVLGDEHQAVQLVKRTIDEALKSGHDLLTCYVLAEGAVPVALLTNSFDIAEQGIALLERHARRAGYSVWLACCACYDEYLRSATAPDPSRLPRFRDALDSMRETGYVAPLTMLLAQYARCLHRYGRVAEAAEALNEALRHCDETGERWFYSKLRQLAMEIADHDDGVESGMHGLLIARNKRSLPSNNRSLRLGRAARVDGAGHGRLRLRAERR